ncbi:MAG: hypothetical protein C4541_02985 [Candidatus Auribacter fodinae]|jgi:hypothetical protein|uniref:Carbohydrate-binding domain-containing protein n=1 Tax=Candidatus Auribacter fodinae TaxID=2093366 RepID=A0A3A4RF19_9BACT|nr:MAG: hypothetical protein C4541_02985 [Candidatus Auribacter fodinae]
MMKKFSCILFAWGTLILSQTISYGEQALPVDIDNEAEQAQPSVETSPVQYDNDTEQEHESATDESEKQDLMKSEKTFIEQKNPIFRNPPIIIDNFDRGSTEGIFSERETSLGAFQGTWAKRPSWSLITKTEEMRRGDTGKSQKMEWRVAGGWCGWYTLLDGLDASDYNCITFWVKGRDGGERFDIGLADSMMQELSIDAKYVGSVNFFIKGGSVTKDWVKAKIPLNRIAGDLNISSLGALVFWFRYDTPGETSAIYIDDIMLEYDGEIEKIEEYNKPRAELDPEHPRTMWVWKIDPVVNLKARQDMFDLCERTAIRTCYVYFGDFNEHDDPAYTKQLEEFLRESHKRDLHIEILTGNPVWCLKENHHLAIQWMKAFLDYNQSRPPELRIDGCSFDVEPYLAGEWQTRRDEVKKEYIDLLKKIRALIDSYPDQHFEVGGAIPFFYKEEGDFEEQMLTYLDYSGLMAYYDTARKIIDVSRYHIDLATRLGKKIYVGVETQDLITMKQGRRANTFYEEGWEEMERVLKQVENEFRNDPGYGAIAMHCYYSYKLLQRGRNTPMKIRPEPEDLDHFISWYQEKGVVIDGNTNDWILTDPSVQDEKTQVVYGRGAWNGKSDYSISAYSMWDLYNIYFLFDITDNTIVQEKTAQDMWEGDHVEFWLDVDLKGDYNEAMNSNDDFQFGFSPGNFNNIPAEAFLFTPEMDAEQYLEYVEIAATKKGNGYIIEVRIDAKMFENVKMEGIPEVDPSKQQLGANRDLITLGPDNPEVAEMNHFRFKDGLMIGFSTDGSDCDDPNSPQKLLTSTSKERIWGDPTTFNAIILKK